jgi:adenylate kinase
MKTAQAILFVGPQGSGKGTQLDALTGHLRSDGTSVTTIQTGEVFRSLAKTETSAARKINECLSAGKLVPTAITNSLVIHTLLEKWAPNSHVIFDGYPRDKAQAETLVEVLEFFSCAGIAVVHLAVPDEVVATRMRERGRADDTPELIARRLQVYHDTTQPILEYFVAHPYVAVHEINGAQSIEDVQAAINHALVI